MIYSLSSKELDFDNYNPSVDEALLAVSLIIENLRKEGLIKNSIALESSVKVLIEDAYMKGKDTNK